VPVAQPHTIAPPQLEAADEEHFLTVVGWDDEARTLATQPPQAYSMPVPKLDEVHRRFSQQEIPARLTVFGTVCALREAANSKLLEAYPPVDADIANAVGEGYVVNYYLHFPALESDQLEMEGDWSGISLLFRRLPNTANLAAEPPLLACYFKKTETHMMAGPNGFRRWSNVTKLPNQASGLATHPVVYVSKGLHNCYYEPTTTTVERDPPWFLTARASAIEEGTQSHAPAGTGGNLEGGGMMDVPWWADILFPPFFFFKMCASGCQYPVSFDRSGIPVDPRTPAEDKAGAGGSVSAPPGAVTGNPPGTPDYPAHGAHPRPLALDVVYVDLTDPGMADSWKFPGAWGAARKADGWGTFLGRERPNLAAWFLWNLYWDTTFGSAGKGAGSLGP
jgi:hypothetical protein